MTKKEPIYRWEAKSLDSVQGYDFPLNSTMTAYGADKSPEYIWDVEVKKLKFNDKFADSTFHPVRQPGVTVLDSTTKKAYREPGAVDESPASQPSQVMPVQAIPPSDWTSFLSGGSLIFGAVLVIVGGTTWWRRR